MQKTINVFQRAIQINFVHILVPVSPRRVQWLFTLVYLGRYKNGSAIYEP